jgi:hypothetical protein
VSATPGPWIHYDDSSSPNKRHEIVALGKTIAHIYCSVPEQDGPNAQLIAAAPDLAKALRSCLNYLENTEGEFGVTFDSADKARAALKKAGL